MSAWTLALALVVLGPVLMVLGLAVMFATLLARRRSPLIAARLLLLGPGVGLVGAALVAAQLPVDLGVRVGAIVTATLLAVLCLGFAIGVRYPQR